MKMKKLLVNSLLWFVVNQMEKLTTETTVRSIVGPPTVQRVRITKVKFFKKYLSEGMSDPGKIIRPGR